MKKNNKAKKRILLLALLLFGTTGLLTASTFAWFTANKTVTISPIQVNVEAQGGIQISADGTNWKSVVTAAEIIGVNSTTYTSSINQIPTVLEPVSTANVMDAEGLMEMYYGTVSSNAGGDYILSSVKDTELSGTAGKFVAFDLFFRADSAVQLYLTTNSGVTTPDATDTGIKNSARVAFINKGNTAIGSPISTIQGLNSGVASPVYMWEPNYTSHTAAAISHANDTYGLTVNATDPVPYSGVKAEFTEVQNILVGQATETAHNTLFTAMNPAYRTVEGFPANLQVFTLPAGISKIRMYMWMEGQDVDCENSASGGNAVFNVQLTTETTP